jgi:hypothetical protein
MQRNRSKNSISPVPNVPLNFSNLAETTGG